MDFLLLEKGVCFEGDGNAFIEVWDWDTIE